MNIKTMITTVPLLTVISSSEGLSCNTNPEVCDENAVCIENPGNLGQYFCKCNAGFTGSGQSCDDLDECKFFIPVCDENANCTNNFGSFSCQCNEGFIGDGLECKTDCNSTNCNENAECIDHPEGDPRQIECRCNPGFDGNGIECEDIDECVTADRCNENEKCANTIGSYTCTCEKGYIRIGITCEPICIENCDNRADGDYQSCQGCSVYATCSNGNIEDNRQCPASGLLWDDNNKTCEHESSTCDPSTSGSGTGCKYNCAGETDGLYTLCDSSCTAFVQCVGEVTTVTHCPTGTLFDTTINVCNHDYNVNCDT